VGWVVVFLVFVGEVGLIGCVCWLLFLVVW